MTLYTYYILCCFFFCNFRYKLNITVPSLKTNISERKIGLFINYLEHLEQVVLPHVQKFQRRLSKTEYIWHSDTVNLHWEVEKLMRLRKYVSEVRIGKKSVLGIGISELRRASELSVITDRSQEPSDYSEESMEAWARCVDLPGLEDNVSTHNTIQNLVRVVIGEVRFINNFLSLNTINNTPNIL